MSVRRGGRQRPRAVERVRAAQPWTFGRGPPALARDRLRARLRRPRVGSPSAARGGDRGRPARARGGGGARRPRRRLAALTTIGTCTASLGGDLAMLEDAIERAAAVRSPEYTRGLTNLASILVDRVGARPGRRGTAACARRPRAVGTPGGHLVDRPSWVPRHLQGRWDEALVHVEAVLRYVEEGTAHYLEPLALTVRASIRAWRATTSRARSRTRARGRSWRCGWTTSSCRERWGRASASSCTPVSTTRPDHRRRAVRARPPGVAAVGVPRLGPRWRSSDARAAGAAGRPRGRPAGTRRGWRPTRRGRYLDAADALAGIGGANGRGAGRASARRARSSSRAARGEAEAQARARARVLALGRRDALRPRRRGVAPDGGVTGQRLPRRACSRSIASKSALKLPSPKPVAPWRSITSKNSVGRSCASW